MYLLSAAIGGIISFLVLKLWNSPETEATRKPKVKVEHDERQRWKMPSIEQHYHRETEEQNSNGCKLLVKKDAMLDSLDATERSYDNSANGFNFTIRKVNLMFVFIVIV